MSAFFGCVFSEPFPFDRTALEKAGFGSVYSQTGAVLAIEEPTRNGSSSPAHPLPNESRRRWVVGEGRIDNSRGFRQRLVREGHEFQTNSDFEVLVHLSEGTGLDWELGLQGAFSFALWDSHESKLRLTRDRLGIKPLYWCGDRHALAFASSLETLHEKLVAVGKLLPDLPEGAIRPLIQPEGWRIRPQALGDYLDIQCVPGPGTIFEGVFSLLPAQRLVWKPGKPPSLETLWRLSFLPKRKVKKEAALAEFEEVFSETVRGQTESGHCTAVLLSGGIGSASIAAEAAARFGNRLKTRTVGFGETGLAEFEQAREISHRLGTDHHETRLPPIGLRDLLDIARHLDQPLGDLEVWRDWALMEAAANGSEVVLSGHGSGSVWGGDPLYSVVNSSRWLPKTKEGLPGNPVVPRRSAKASFGFGDRFCPPETLYRRLRHLDPNGELRHRFLAEDLADPLMDRPWREEGLSIHERLLARDACEHLPFRLLPRLEAASRRHRVEIRLPWLECRLFETLAHFPKEHKINGGIPCWLLRSALARGSRWRPPLPPNPATSRPVPPMGRWLKTELAGLFEEGPLAGDSCLSEFCDPREVRAAFESHRAGVQRLDRLLWALLVLEFWLRQSSHVL